MLFRSAQAWERMKSMVKNCPTHGLTMWMVIQTFYAGLNFSSRNLLDSATGGTFISTTLAAATKILDEMMTNYSQWHTERAPSGKKVNYVEEISSSSDKVDMIMSMLSTNKSPIDPNNVALASLISQEKDQVYVNFLNRSNFNNNAYRNNIGSNNSKPYPPNNGNSYGNSYNLNNNVSSDLESVLKDFITTQRALIKLWTKNLKNLIVLSLKWKILLMMLKF